MTKLRCSVGLITLAATDCSLAVLLSHLKPRIWPELLTEVADGFGLNRATFSPILLLPDGQTWRVQPESSVGLLGSLTTSPTCQLRLLLGACVLIDDMT
eukprot:2389751-Amphidinium_carterae.1